MKKSLTIFLYVIIAVVLLVVGFLGIIVATPWGEQFVTRQVNSYLAKKLKTPFSIGRVSYHIPDWISLENVFFATPKGDTLLAGRRLYVNLDMMGLLQNRIAINEIELDRIRLNVTRTLPDTAFNFQFLIDAFDTGGAPQPVDTAAAPLDFNLSQVVLKDVRAHYVDDVAGADVNVFLDSLRARFDRTNLDRSQYHLSSVTVDGLDAKTRIYPGIDTPDTPETVSSDTLDLQLGAWQLRRARWDIRAEEAGFQTKGSVGKLAVTTDYFYLDGQRIGLSSLELTNSDILAQLLRQTAAKPAPAPEAAPTPEDAGWRVKLGQARLADNRIRYDDQNAPVQRSGMDYGHLDIQDLNLTGQGFSYQPEGISGQIRQGSFREKSGFALQQLTTNFLYSDTQTSLTNLLVQTPRTVLRDQLVLRYDSLGQLSRPAEAGRVRIRANLRQNTISVADILLLAPFLADTPPFVGNRNAVIRVNTRMSGTLAALDIPTFELTALSGTRLRAGGQLRNVTDVNRFGMDLTIREATTRSADIRKLVPPGTLPDSLSFPPDLRLTGRLNGQLDNLTIDTQLRTAWGNADFDGALKGFVSGRGQAYRGTLNLAGFEAGRWLQQPATLGRITARASFDGQGLDVKTMQTSFRLAVQEAELSGYRYQNLDVQGRLAAGILDVKGGINDPNARVVLDTKVGLLGAYPSVVGEVAVEQLDLYKLKFYSEPLELRGRLTLDMPSTNPTNPKGTLAAKDAVVTLKGKTYPIDSLYLRADSVNGRKSLLARLPFGRVNMSGQYQYTQLYDIFVGEVNRYFTIPEIAYNRIPPPYSFYIAADVHADPLLTAFAPGLTRLDTVKLDAYLDNIRDTTMAATLRTGVVIYDTTVVNGASLNLLSINNQLNVAGQVNEVKYGDMNISLTKLTALVADNQVHFQVVNKDSVDQDRHGLAGRLTSSGGNYRLQLDRENALITNYESWSSDTAGYIQYGKEGVLVDRFSIRSEGKSLLVNSLEPRPNAPLRVRAENIDLANVAKLANQDTTLVAGTLNGDVILRDYMTNLSFTGDVKVDSLKAMGKPLGNLDARFANASDKRIGVDLSLKGEYNDLDVNGFYNPAAADQALDFRVVLNRLDTRAVEAFSFGQLRNARGRLTGRFTVAGSTSKPRMNGELSFDSVAFNVAQVNATYRINQETIAFNDQTITFNKFNLQDSLGRVLTTDGTVTIRTLPDVAYNLQVTAKNFTVLNAARKDNDYAYGQASITSSLRIRGSGTEPSVFGTVRLDNGSKITAVLPDNSPAVNEAKETVVFIQPGDTLALAKYLVRPKRDTTDTRIVLEELSKSNISLSLEADEQSEVTIIVDELNGDYLRARGNARLNLSLNAAGQITLAGRYEVTEGEYAMTYQVLKRQFTIQKGSSITWTGDPLKADVNITAIYRTEAVPADLVANELSAQSAAQAKRKLPFDVALKMSGNLTKPQLDFDINLVQGNGLASGDNVTATAITTKLAQLRQDPSQMNKQVFGLLVLNSFISENSSSFLSGSGGGGGGAGELAFNSVSKLLSEQLERLASNVLKGFDVDFNLLSQSGYANTGSSSGSRTDLNVGLSKSFMQGRLTVSVGRNFVLQNTTNISRNPAELFDNVSLNYNLTRDGKYMVRAYRNNNSNQSQAVLEGFIIETGIGFVITIDYNTLSELFSKKNEAAL